MRVRLAQVLQDPDYSPINEEALSRRLGLEKKELGAFSAEIKKLVDAGGLIRLKGNRLALPERNAPKPQPAVSEKPFERPQPPKGKASRKLQEKFHDKKPAKAAPGSPGGLNGRIQFRSGGSAYVVVEGAADQPSLQIMPSDTGVALPGDTVEARIIPGKLGRNPGEKMARVIRVVSRARDTIVGNLRRQGRSFMVAADDPRFIYEIAVQDPSRGKLSPLPQPGDKVVVKLDEWKNRNDFITGTITERLGRTHEPRAELLGVYVKYSLDPNFPEAVVRDAQALPDVVHAEELVGRLDYRQSAVFTIDPDDAKDFDDALSIESLPAGETKVGIHIADVSTYVKRGTALDREAQSRGNSTYLVGTVVPMLPEKLSNGLCSLVEAQDRLCKAVFLTFTPQGTIRETEYANTVIRSKKRLTYKQAYALMFQDDLEAIRSLPLPPKHQTGSTGRALRELSDGELKDLQQWTRKLWTIAKRLREDRMDHGSLDLDMPETKVFVDEQGYADRLERIEHDESHQLIEEFMLAANEALARLTRQQRLPSLYRVHDEPDPEKLEEYRSFVATFGIHVGDLTLHTEVAKLLQILQRHPQGYTLRTQFLRSLKKACYRSTPDGHYGLNKKDYTHFTSPIRRYADLVVHRVLGAYLARKQGENPKPAYDAKGVDQLAEHLSLTEINSAEAERESVKIKLLEFFERELKKKVQTRFQAVVTEVRRHGFFVELTESMTFGFVSVEAMRDDDYQLNTAGTAIVGRKRKRSFEVGQTLELVVDKVDRFSRQIDFRPAS